MSVEVPPPPHQSEPPGSKNPHATRGLVAGIGTVLCAILPPPMMGLAFVLAPVALISGVMGLREASRSNVGYGGAITGIVLGSLGVVTAVVGLVIVGAF